MATQPMLPYVAVGGSLWQRHKRTIVTSAAAGFAVYLAYRAYNSSAVARTQNMLAKWHSVLAQYADAMAAVSGSCSVIASDLREFLNSDTQDIPLSLRQLNKLLQSNELQGLMQTSVATLARGVAEGTSAACASSAPSGPSALETIIEAVLSDRGRSLLGLAVGTASRNATSVLCEFLERMQSSSQQASSGAFNLESLVRLLASEEGDRILSLLVTKSVRTAVATYVDATAGVNMYDDMVSSIVKQDHRDAITEVMTRTTATFCREVAMAYRKNSMPANRQLQSTASMHSEGPQRSSMDGSGMPFVSDDSHGQLRSMQHAHAAATKAKISTAHQSKQNAPRGPSPAWVRQVVDLVKEKDVRSLAIDVVGSATREATRGVVETLSCSLSTYGGRGNTMPVYSLFSAVIALMMYTMSPAVSI